MTIFFFLFPFFFGDIWENSGSSSDARKRRLHTKQERRRGGGPQRERLTHPDLWNRNKWMGEASPLSSSFFLSPACAKYFERDSALDSHKPFTLFPNEFPNSSLSFFLFIKNPLTVMQR